MMQNFRGTKFFQACRAIYGSSSTRHDHVKSVSMDSALNEGQRDEANLLSLREAAI